MLAGALEEDSRDPGRPPNKRKKIEARATWEQHGYRGCDAAEEDNGCITCNSRRGFKCITCCSDPHNDLPTQRKPKDPDTTEAVQSRRDKAVVSQSGTLHCQYFLHRARWGEDTTMLCIIMNQWEEEEKKRVIIVTCSDIVCSMGRLLDPVPMLYVGLTNKTMVEGQLMFFNHHYDIALLEITIDSPLQRPSIGSGPSYGQEVFLLSRDEELSLMARHGEILWLEESNYLGRNYQMFVSCEVPEDGNGGPVIDHDGNITGMASGQSPHTAVISISTIVTCIEMWLKFRRIARPIHGLGVRTMELLDVALQDETYDDYDIDSGYIVDVVSYDSAAENLGIVPGDVIVSLDDQHELTLPELEDYLLSLGWQFLKDPSSMVYLKLEVYDLIGRSKRSISLPVRFCDASEMVDID